MVSRLVGSPFQAVDSARFGHGIQLAVAVSVSYVVSVAFGLPENFWAVMSALIVVRPNTGSTLGAGWDRVRGTVFGTLFGLAGVWVRHHGLGTPLATLSIVAGLAFASALLPAMRSAPIAALIVLTSAGIAGHSALQVAELRVVEIAIGVVTGLAVSMVAPGSRAVPRFDHECAAMLRRAAAPLLAGDESTTSMEAREAASEARRAAVRELVILGMAADREHRLPFRRRGRKRDAGVHRRLALLVARTAQDAELFTRLFEAMPQRHADPAWVQHRSAASSAMTEVADAIERPGDARPMPALDALRRLSRLPRSDAPSEGSARPVATMLAGPATLLVRDLIGLSRHAAVSTATPDGSASTD